MVNDLSASSRGTTVTLAPPATDAVDVWYLALQAPGVRQWGWLSADERKAASRLRARIDSERYVASHAAVRRVLAAYLGCDPGHVSIEAEAEGKPRLGQAHQPRGLRFNLSHSGDRGLLAIGRHRCVGADIEQARPLDDLDVLAGRVLSPQERTALDAREGDEDRLACFLALWTRKEAAAKAVGAGLDAALARLRIEPADPATAARFVVRGVGGECPTLHGHAFMPEAGYHAAVVTDAADFRIAWHEWPGAQWPS